MIIEYLYYVLGHRDYAQSIHFTADIINSDMMKADENFNFDFKFIRELFDKVYQRSRNYLIPIDSVIKCFKSITPEQTEQVRQFYSIGSSCKEDETSMRIAIGEETKQFTSRMQMNAVARALREYYDNVNGHSEEILTNSQLVDLLKSSLRKVIPGADNSEEETDMYLSIYDQPIWEVDKGEIMSTYMPSLDLILNGGWQKKRLTMILAGSGTGKSTFLCSLAAEQMRNGKNVAYINLEMVNYEVTLNIMSCLTRTPYDEMECNPYEMRDKLYKDYPEEKWGKFCLIDDSADSGITIDLMKEKLLEAEKVNGVKFDIVFIDYLDLIEVDDARIDRPDQKLKKLAKGAKRLAKNYNWSVVSLLQTNRSGQDDCGELSFAQKIGESYASMQDMDNCLELYFLKDGVSGEPDPDKRVVRAAKVRQNKNRGTVGSKFYVVYNDVYKQYTQSDEGITRDVVRSFHKVVDKLHDKVRQKDIMEICQKFGISCGAKGTVSKYYAKMGYKPCKETEEGIIDKVDEVFIDNLFRTCYDIPVMGLNNYAACDVTGINLFNN